MSDQKPLPSPRPFAGGLPPPGRPMPLSLPRRSPTTLSGKPTGGLISLAYADADPEVQRRVEERINSRAPFPGALAGSAASSAAERARLLEIDRAQRLREQELDTLERALEELQMRLGDREREIAELENLLLARERVLMAQRKAPTLAPFAASAEETSALEKLRATLDAQEATITEARVALRERESFVEQSETTLLNKVSAQQEHEIMLDQRYEDLRRAEQELRVRLAGIDPVAAAELEADRARKRDEFNE